MAANACDLDPIRLPAMGTTAGLRFRCNGHGIADYPPGGVFGPRTLRDWEFVWIIEGQAAWEVDGASHPCPSGSIVLARPGQRDRFVWDAQRPTRHGFVHFSMRDAGLGRGLPLLRPPGGGSGIVRPLLLHLLWLLDARPSTWEALADGALGQALDVWRADADMVAGEGGGAMHPLIERVLAHVAQAWRDGRWRPLPLGRLAQAAGVTPAWLIRLFVREVGASPIEALRLLRLDRAAQLLARGEMPVAEVASRSGFADPFHFSRAFRTAYGRSPRAFRGHVAEGGDMPAAPLVRVRHLAERLRQGRL
jgi:AraC-like DNA-binding protein